MNRKLRHPLRHLTPIALFAAMLMPLAVQAQNRTWIVEVTNLTQSQIISPPLAVVHDRKVELFEPGSAASSELAILAEDGNPMPLADAMLASPHVFSATAAGGPVLPGTSIQIEVEVEHPHNFVSVVGMLVSTNDAFVGVQSLPVPRDGTILQLDATAYDAGSEANNESCSYIPGPPCGSGGVRATDGAEGFIHVHNGVHGIGDLEPPTWDFNNPVARIRVWRNR